MMIQNEITITFIPPDRTKIFYLDIPLARVDAYRLRKARVPDAPQNLLAQLVLVFNADVGLGKCLFNAKEQPMRELVLTFGSMEEVEEAISSLRSCMRFSGRVRISNSFAIDVSSDRQQAQHRSDQTIHEKHPLAHENHIVERVKAQVQDVGSGSTRKLQKAGNFVKLLEKAITPEPMEPTKGTLRIILKRTNSIEQEAISLHSTGTSSSSEHEELTHKRVLVSAHKSDKSGKRTRRAKPKGGVRDAQVRKRLRKPTNKQVVDDIYDILASEDNNEHPIAARNGATKKKIRKDIRKPRSSKKGTSVKQTSTIRQADSVVVHESYSVAGTDTSPCVPVRIEPRQMRAQAKIAMEKIKITSLAEGRIKHHDDENSIQAGKTLDDASLIQLADPIENDFEQSSGTAEQQGRVGRATKPLSSRPLQLPDANASAGVLENEEQTPGRCAMDEESAREVSVLSLDQAHTQNGQDVPSITPHTLEEVLPVTPGKFLEKIGQVQAPTTQSRSSTRDKPVQQPEHVHVNEENSSSLWFSKLSQLVEKETQTCDDTHGRSSTKRRKLVKNSPSAKITNAVPVDHELVDFEQLVRSEEKNAAAHAEPIAVNTTPSQVRSISVSQVKSMRRNPPHVSRMSVQVSVDGSPIPNQTAVLLEERTLSPKPIKKPGPIVSQSTTMIASHVLSSNSKTVPQFPEAESQAISGYSQVGIVKAAVARGGQGKPVNPFESNGGDLHAKPSGLSAFAQMLSNMAVKNVRLQSQAIIIPDDPDRTLVDAENMGKTPSNSSSAGESDDEFQTEQDEHSTTAEIEWEAALAPRHRTLLDVLGHISRRLISHLIDSETAVKDIVDDYARDGVVLIKKLEDSHREQCQAIFRSFDASKQKLAKDFRKFTEKLEVRRLAAREVKTVLDEWKKSQSVLNLERREAA
jgi:hypothetical protein